MNALARIKSAGFDVWLKDNGNIGITPFNSLTPQQLEFLKEHKTEIIQALAANDTNVAAPAAEPKTNHSITCKTCIHFESYHAHGGGAGTCRAEVMPFGACWWSDIVHQCGKHLSSASSEAAHNAEGRYFKFLVTRQDGTQFYSCSMPRLTLAEVREQYPDATNIKPVEGEDYPNDLPQ